MFERMGKVVLAATLLAGCGFRESDARPLVERALRETPRLAQLAFALPAPPVNTFNTSGQYPRWVGAVGFERFTFRRVSDGSYEARALATLAPGAGLSVPPSTRATLELTVDFTAHTTPAPIMFLPEAHDLMPGRWHLHAVNGRPASESGAVGDYREP